jgi:putative phosphoribosyl transferase
MTAYRDRYDAGVVLARELAEYADQPKALVLALPRGGVPVAYEVATRLRAPLDVYVVRKLGVPGHEELAMGALAGDGSCVIDRRIVAAVGVSQELLDSVIAREIAELRRRQAAYRGQRPVRRLDGQTIILVDDGLATGSSMYAAVLAVREDDPAAIVVAVPVGAAETVQSLRAVADRVVCPRVPEFFGAVGLYYDDFAQTSDDEVRSLLELELANREMRAAGFRGRAP